MWGQSVLSAIIGGGKKSIVTSGGSTFHQFTQSSRGGCQKVRRSGKAAVRAREVEQIVAKMVR